MRVLSDVDAGKPKEEVAKSFSVGAHHKTLAKKTPSTGRESAIPGRPARKGKMLKEWLPEHLEANDDHTLEEHREAFVEPFGSRCLPAPSAEP